MRRRRRLDLLMLDDGCMVRVRVRVRYKKDHNLQQALPRILELLIMDGQVRVGHHTQFSGDLTTKGEGGHAEDEDEDSY